MSTSKMTKYRPKLWAEAVALATGITGMVYVDKLPAADGAISCCGGGAYGGWRAPIIHSHCEDKAKRGKFEELYNDGGSHREYLREKWPDKHSRIQKKREREKEEREKEEKEEREGGEDRDKIIEDLEYSIENETSPIVKKVLRKHLEDEIKKRDGIKSAPVPPGAVEWLLHEVGHYVAATEGERLLPDYGLGTSLVGRDADREWAAWAFEEIVLAPFGPARLIAPPEHRSGVGFTRDRIPGWAMRRAHLGLIELDVDLAGLREMCGRWLRWAVMERQVSPAGLHVAMG